MKRKKTTLLIMVALSALYIVTLFAGFVSPYDFTQQNRALPFAPPTRIHFTDAAGTIHLRPFVCISTERPNALGTYVENCEETYPVHFFVRSARYVALGFLRSDLHLFGAEAPASIFVMGTDGYGRDVFSRFLFGGQISLFAGLLATLLTLALGTILGTCAGYYGGWVDSAVMRGTELFIALPWLYLLFALRAFLSPSLNAGQAFFLLFAVIGTLGWARPARLIRGIVLSTSQRQYVLAARLFGGSDLYVMRRHIVPDAYSTILTQAALLIPQYVLAEVVLSFLGLGVGEPAASWGNMLSTLQDYAVLVSYWWISIPGLVLIPVFLGYLLLASELSGRAADRL